MNSLKSYVSANPKVTGDLQKIGEPLTGLSTKCKLPISPISMPQALSFIQNAQGGLPAGLPAPNPAGPPLSAIR